MRVVLVALDAFVALGKFDLKRRKGLLVGLATSLTMAALVSAAAATLQAPWTGPLEYARICDASGSGFFSIPGTGSCLRTGDLALAEPRGFDPSFHIAVSPCGARAAAALGRLGSQADTFNSIAGTNTPRETAVFEKTFIGTAGLTAGREQSLFDFQAAAYNCERSRGSFAAIDLLSYTATFGAGFSTALFFENHSDRRAASASTAAASTPVEGGSPAALQPRPANANALEIDGNHRSGPASVTPRPSTDSHQTRASLFGSTAAAMPAGGYAFPGSTGTSYGFALQGGVQLNADYLSPSDKLWLQAAYEKDAPGYSAGSGVADNNDPADQKELPGSGVTPLDYADGWNPRIKPDCVFITGGTCEPQWGGPAIGGGGKPSWLPILSSAAYGSYLEVHYPAGAFAGFGGALGVSNLKEMQASPPLVPAIQASPKSFDMGAEFMYKHLNEMRPAGLASPDATLTAAGMPAYPSNTTQSEGRLRIQRAF